MNDWQQALTRFGHLAEVLVYVALVVAVVGLLVFAARSHR